MNDPTRQPGYQFVALRLLRASYETLSDAPLATDGELGIAYADHVDVKEQSVVLRQSVTVRVLNPASPEQAFLQVSVELEGRFQGSGDVNLDPHDFANNHAPALLFAFTREWIHRLTSAAAPWPPILLPPINVLEVRKQNAKPEPKTRAARAGRRS